MNAPIFGHYNHYIIQQVLNIALLEYPNMEYYI